MTERALVVADAVAKAIELLDDGVPIDRACKRVHSELTRRRFRGALRKDPALMEAYKLARQSYLRFEAEELLALADTATGMDRDELAALKVRIETRKWMAEKLLDDYQPKIKNEHSGALSLTVVTGVPRAPLEDVKDAEFTEGSIEDLL